MLHINQLTSALTTTTTPKTTTMSSPIHIQLARTRSISSQASIKANKNNKNNNSSSNNNDSNSNDSNSYTNTNLRMPSPHNLQISRHRPISSQVSIQPNVPHHMILQSRNSTNSIVTVSQDGSQPKHVLHQNQKSFAVKKFRMRSLLWVKPQGQAESSTKSTIAQVCSQVS